MNMIKEAGVYCNGKLVGFHPKPKELVKNIKEKKRRGELPYDVTVCYYHDLNEVYVNSDPGRALRPLIVVEKGKPKLTKEHLKLIKENKMRFSDLVEAGVIEFLDAEEEENAYIALDEKDLTPEHTHLEIYPALLFGVIAAMLPYPEHNTSPRDSMATQYMKQSLGLFASNYSKRVDTRAHIMFYPQRPLVKSKFYDALGASQRPAGQNFVIAVTPYYGYNINDAVVMNKASIERGLGRTISFRTYANEERRYPGGQKDRFERPRPEIFGYRGEEAYQYLDEEGIIEPEFEVKQGDVLIGKTSPPRFLEEVRELEVLEEKRRENSTAVRHGEHGTVDWVLATEGEGGNKLVKVRVRNLMIPEIGDKFAARHGQKGVIGLIAEEADMPFTEKGIIPDLIFNPHAVPGRTTIGYLLETLGGKVASLRGKEVDATPFDNESEKDLREFMKKYGFKDSGKEVMYNGITGEKMPARIFVGTTYYMRLKHLVSDKIHARARGPVQILTRQPTEGRAREGGLKFGEMERDTLIGHGAAMLLKERLLEESDKVTEYVCKKCGVIAVYDQVRNRKWCPICGESKEVYPIEMSYSFKLLLNEIMALGIYPKLILKDKV